jgi:hypothetical protein
MLRMLQAILPVATLLAGSALLVGCQDTLVYGESTAFNLAIHANDNPQTPIEVNAGLKRHVGEMAPPVLTTDDDNGTTKAAGEAVSSFSGFALTYDRDGVFSGDLFIRTQFASGLPAQLLANEPAAAVEVVQADFDRDKAFVAPGTQARVTKIVKAIETLDAPKALLLVCNPPVKETKMAELIAASDPDCLRATDAQVARDILAMQAASDDRSEANLKAWEKAVGIP